MNHETENALKKKEAMKTIANGMSSMTVQQAGLQGFTIEETPHLIAMSLGFTLIRARNLIPAKDSDRIANEVMFCLQEALFKNGFDIPEPSLG